MAPVQSNHFLAKDGPDTALLQCIVPYSLSMPRGLILCMDRSSGANLKPNVLVILTIAIMYMVDFFKKKCLVQNCKHNKSPSKKPLNNKTLKQNCYTGTCTFPVFLFEMTLNISWRPCAHFPGLWDSFPLVEEKEWLFLAQDRSCWNIFGTDFKVLHFIVSLFGCGDNRAKW